MSFCKWLTLVAAGGEVSNCWGPHGDVASAYWSTRLRHVDRPLEAPRQFRPSTLVYAGALQPRFEPSSERPSPCKLRCRVRYGSRPPVSIRRLCSFGRVRRLPLSCPRKSLARLGAPKGLKNCPFETLIGIVVGLARCGDGCLGSGFRLERGGSEGRLAFTTYVHTRREFERVPSGHRKQPAC